MGMNPKKSLILAVLSALGTPLFGYSISFYKKTISLFFLMLGIYLLFLYKNKVYKSKFILLGVGLSLGYSGICDYPFLIICIFILFYAHTFLNFKEISLLILGMLPFLVFLGMYHKVCFGEFWYSAYRFRVDKEANVMGPPNLINFLSFLISIEDGLLIYYPLSLISLWGYLKCFKNRKFLKENILFLSIIIFIPVFYSGWSAYNPRISHAHDCSLITRHLLITSFLLIIGFRCIDRILNTKLFYILSFLSFFSTYLASQAGYIPSSKGVVASVYAFKVLITSLGTSVFFSEILPKMMKISTLHLYVSNPDIRFFDVLRDTSLFFKLLLNQLIFSLIFWIIFVVLLKGLYKSIKRF